MKYTVAATVRNEGPFLVEWVAWQKAMGFTDVLFAYNDCTDHSPALMAAMAAGGWCTAAEHTPGEMTPVRSGLATIHAHPLVAQTDWLFVCDVDEYLIPKRADRTVAGLLEGMHERFAGVSVQWKTFGTSNLILYQDAPLHETFTRCAWPKSYTNGSVKSFIYKPLRFHKLTPHVPRGMDVEGNWGEGANRWGLVHGAEFPYDPNGPRVQRSKRPDISHKGAQLNHYITKSLESVDFKMGTPCPLRDGNVQRYTESFYETYDRNGDEDTSALEFSDRYAAIHAQIMATPEVLRLHKLCCLDYIHAMHEKRGSDPAEDPRIPTLMAQAEAAQG